MNLHLLATDWNILKVGSENFVGLQAKQTQSKHGVIFPIYCTGATTSPDYFVFKKNSLSQRIDIIEIRRKKVLVTRDRPEFRNFRSDTADQIVFMQTNHGIISFYIHEMKINFIYLTQKESDPSGEVDGCKELQELDSNLDFRWLILFGEDTLVLINSFVIFVTRVHFSGSTPQLMYVNQMKPFDMVRGLSFSSDFIVLIGFQSVQLLQQKKESGYLRTAFIAKHEHMFMEDVLYSVVSKCQVYISNGTEVFSFSFRDKIRQYSKDSEFY